MIKGSLSISKLTSNVQEIDGKFCIRLEDNNYLKVVDMIITPEELMLALSGRSNSPVTFELGKMEFVGKIREQETISVKYPEYLYRQEDIQEFIRNNYAGEYEQDGWMLDLSLTSQKSTTTDKEGQRWAHFKRTRYV